MKLIIVSGLSGSGKSNTMKVLEDHGYYCVDNLPVSFLPTFIDFCEKESKILALALSIDSRTIGTIEEFENTITLIKRDHAGTDLIFVEAKPNVLIRRYSETRRPHPFGGPSISVAINEEIKEFAPIRKLADIKLDTTKTNIHEMKDIIKKYLDSDTTTRMNINIVSFGFKHGIPIESDLMLDVRFLPNPYFEDELKDLTGLDKPVIKYLSAIKQTKILLRKYFGLLNFLLHNYTIEGRSNLTISIGCTGGRHRSVFIAERIKKHLRKRHPLLHITHRDIDK